MAGILHIDTVDQLDNGLIVENVRGHRDAVRKSWPTRNVPGSIAKAAVVVSSQPVFLPRTVDIFGHVKSTLAVRTHADLLANLAALEADCHTPDEVDLSLVDDLTIKLVVRCERFEPRDFAAGMIQTGIPIRIQFIAHDPRWVSV